jgi:hypothetical protein
MKISGQVFDSNNEPLASANVTLRSGAQAGKLGVVTNLDGKFSIDNNSIQSDSIFEISYIGFVSQTWSALELQDKKVTLLDSIEQLNEVVVINRKKPNLATTVSGGSALGQHLKKYKTAYVGGITLAGALLLISKIKK